MTTSSGLTVVLQRDEVGRLWCRSDTTAQMLGRHTTMHRESPQESPSSNDTQQHSISRRRLLKAGVGGAGLVGASVMSASLDSSRSAFAEEPQSPQGHAHH